MFLAKREDIGSLWNWPRCGLPSAFHSQEDRDALLDGLSTWWTSGDLFCSAENGDLRPLECALAHLLQAGLLCQDLDHAQNSRQSACGTLEGTILLDRALRQNIRDMIVEGAVTHNNALQSIMADYDETAPGSPLLQTDDVQLYDAEAVTFACSVSDHNERLMAECAPPDAYTRTIRTSLLLESRNDDLPHLNAAIRNEQNKENRQRTGHKHPPRAAPTRSLGPDLAFVNDVTLPDVSAVEAEPPKRRKQKPQQRLTIRTKVNPPPRTTRPSSPSEGTSRTAQTVHKSSTKTPRKRSTPAASDEPAHKRPRLRTQPLFEPGTSDEEQEVFDLDNVSGDDSDAMPMQEDPPVSKPRPRPVKAGDLRKAPGISTSFHTSGSQEKSAVADTLDAPTPSRGRRLSIKSSSLRDKPVTEGPQTRARSRSVRFAAAPPSAHTRSKYP